MNSKGEIFFHYYTTNKYVLTLGSKCIFSKKGHIFWNPWTLVFYPRNIFCENYSITENITILLRHEPIHYLKELGISGSGRTRNILQLVFLSTPTCGSSLQFSIPMPCSKNISEQYWPSQKLKIAIKKYFLKKQKESSAKRFVVGNYGMGSNDLPIQHVSDSISQSAPRKFRWIKSDSLL